MSQGFATFLLMNNYFHDVATAMLLACSIMLLVMLKGFGGVRDAVLVRYIAAVFRGVTAIFWFSVLWIISSGILRVVTFRSFEWFNASQKRFEAGLLVKYGIAAVLMIAGSVLWARLARALRGRLRA